MIVLAGGKRCLRLRVENLTTSRMHSKAVFIRKYSRSLNDVGALFPTLINHWHLSQPMRHRADMAFQEIYSPPGWRGFSLRDPPSSTRVFHQSSVCPLHPFTWPDPSPPLHPFLQSSPTLLLVSSLAASRPPQMLEFSFNAGSVYPRVKTQPSASSTAIGHQTMRAAPLLHCVGVATEIKWKTTHTHTLLQATTLKTHLVLLW